jgi:hypothetical protein
MAPDRKALRREYNTANGKVLVLSGHDIPALLNRHRAQLRLGLHRNVELQQDWTTAGEQAFAFEVIDTLVPQDTPSRDPAQDLAVLEQLWLEKLKPFAPAGYNSVS